MTCSPETSGRWNSLSLRETSPVLVGVFDLDVLAWMKREDDKRIEVHGRAGGVHSAVGGGRRADRREAGIGQATFSNWRAKYAGLMPPVMRTFGSCQGSVFIIRHSSCAFWGLSDPA